RQGFITQGCCVVLGNRRGETLDAVERAITYHSLVLGDQSTTARAGAIKLLRTLRTQACTILRVHSSTNWPQTFHTRLSSIVHDLPPHTRRDHYFGSSCVPHRCRRGDNDVGRALKLREAGQCAYRPHHERFSCSTGS